MDDPTELPPLRLVPLPGLKSGLTAALSGTTLSLAALAGLLWEQLKKRLFPEKK